MGRAVFDEKGCEPWTWPAPGDSMLLLVGGVDSCGLLGLVSLVVGRGRKTSATAAAGCWMGTRRTVVTSNQQAVTSVYVYCVYIHAGQYCTVLYDGLNHHWGSFLWCFPNLDYRKCRLQEEASAEEQQQQQQPQPQPCLTTTTTTPKITLEL